MIDLCSPAGQCWIFYPAQKLWPAEKTTYSTNHFPTIELYSKTIYDTKGVPVHQQFKHYLIRKGRLHWDSICLIDIRQKYIKVKPPSPDQGRKHTTLVFTQLPTALPLLTHNPKDTPQYYIIIYIII